MGTGGLFEPHWLSLFSFFKHTITDNSTIGGHSF